MFGPVIQGQVARLRPPRTEDAANMITWFEDMEVTHHLFRRNPPSLEEEKEWIERMARDPNEVLWIVEHEGRAVGDTAIHGISWRDGSAMTGTVIGDKTVWGRGLGREVMQLRVRYAFTQLPLRKLKSGYLDGNEASGRAQAAAGYREVGRYRQEHFVGGSYVDLIVTEVLRDDWLKQNSL
jgi:[ribosomal protein S5]-alanine N-acetyltransferase